MYVPRHFATDEVVALRELLELTPLVQLVSTADDGGLVATALPMLLDESDDTLRLLGHVARANDHWRRFNAGAESLAIVTGPDTYISPSNYATKARTHQVVPTWNYEQVHALGELIVHDDPEWVHGLVTALTDVHERAREVPWKVSDAPDDFIELRLRGIVGIELRVTRLEAKAKLSQDKPADDIAGVEAGLADGSAAERAVATRMARLRSSDAS